jgi:hypothetical protein
MNELSDSERIGAAIRAAVENVEAPPRLRASVAARSRDERPKRRWIAVPAFSAAAVAGLVAVVLVAIGSGGGPTIADAAGLALRTPTLPPPAAQMRNERFLKAGVGGVAFPNYRYSTPFSAAGARSDEISGRRARTVIYSLGSKHIGYTIVSGKPLPVPKGARVISHGNERFAVLHRHGALVVTWRDKGHTCVLASRTASLKRLVIWAGWT